MRCTRFGGVFQRCQQSYGARCRRHRFCFHVELGRGPDGQRRQATRGGFICAADAATGRSKVVAQYRVDRWPQHPTMTVWRW